MESVLGFNDLMLDDVVEGKSGSLKLVPWLSWDEWKFVRESLFSSSPDSVASAMNRIGTWRSRGCIPVYIDVTESIVHIQQQDPYFRNDLDGSDHPSEETLRMAYCMAIMRLVNGVIEKTRKKDEISIGEAADAICIPRMLVDIRHEGAHRDLPSVQLLRMASEKALDWLVSYYWEPQEKMIPTQGSRAVSLRKEIKRSLRYVELCLKAKQAAKSVSSHPNGKRIRQAERLFGVGRSKFLFRIAGKTSQSKFTGSKKQLAISLKNILRLYSSFAPEVVDVLLEFLQSALEPSNSGEPSEDSQITQSIENKQTALDDWKSVVLKLSNKKPEFLLSLSQAVVEKLETTQALNCIKDNNQDLPNSSNSCEAELLSCLLEWLIANLQRLNAISQEGSPGSKVAKIEKHLPKSTVLGLLQRCLLASSPGNHKLMGSALTLAQLTEDASVLHKVKKLALLEQPLNSEADSLVSLDETILAQEESALREAEDRFQLISRRVRTEHEKSSTSDMGIKSKWTVSKSWNPCPIGMLPHRIGFSGRLPVLECRDETALLGSRDCGRTSLGKREAEQNVESMDTTSPKKMKEGEAGSLTRDNGIKGRLLIDGFWKKVGEQELLTIASTGRPENMQHCRWNDRRRVCSQVTPVGYLHRFSLCWKKNVVGENWVDLLQLGVDCSADFIGCLYVQAMHR